MCSVTHLASSVTVRAPTRPASGAGRELNIRHRLISVVGHADDIHRIEDVWFQIARRNPEAGGIPRQVNRQGLAARLYLNCKVHQIGIRNLLPPGGKALSGNPTAPSRGKIIQVPRSAGKTAWWYWSACSRRSWSRETGIDQVDRLASAGAAGVPWYRTENPPVRSGVYNRSISRERARRATLRVPVERSNAKAPNVLARSRAMPQPTTSACRRPRSPSVRCGTRARRDRSSR